MEMTASALSLAVIRPANRAFWWPRLRVRSTPQNRGDCWWRAEMISQVRSLEPSLTKSTRLFSLIFPAVISCSSLAFKRLEVSGRTSCSL